MVDLNLYTNSEKRLESLVHTLRIFSTTIGLDFFFTKCAKLVVRRGKVVAAEGIELPDGRETIYYYYHYYYYYYQH